MSAPVKFDDIPKVANDVLNDDYQTAGFQLKAKQKTNWDGAVATTTVDLETLSKGSTNSSKLSWKFPKPFGLAGLSIDKLEMDKAGKFKLECVADKGLHKVADLKLEVKSDLVDPAKAVTGITFTGLKDQMVKFETKPMKPDDFTAEATRKIGLFTVGLKFGAANLTKPDLGVRCLSGPYFASLLVKEKFSVFSLNAFYKVNADAKVACAYEQGGKKSGNFSVGLAYALKPGTTLKAKLQQDQSVSASVKHDLAKGLTITKGVKYDTKSGSYTYGLQVSVE
eukprot:gnl/TRDRNA2_/TRDRNA2_186804_c0_seq1.p1 gnl/TRDRNA2_/TRDRNA2_186804_c0~~gnl/TRDRNA2_/TRDRNA2_186804_c0_seq1.p1  ORF type:complete len:281 (-),score=83.11 gnl/TRDRNA2_/TRDRNA2_186804_c0_seq1:193-1035(-)